MRHVSRKICAHSARGSINASSAATLIGPSPTFAGRSVGDDAPAVAVGAIEQLLRVARERVRANALEKRRGRAFAELIAVQR